MKEKCKIHFRRFLWLIALVTCIAIPLYVLQHNVTIVNSSFDVSYNKSEDSSDCSITIVFDTDVDSATATVYYYGSNHKYISMDIVYLTKIGDKTFSGTSYISGKVQFCSVESCTVFSELSTIVLCVSAPIFIVVLSLFICSLTHRCRIYRYNGIKILIYAGWFHHYMKVDGEIVDEYNTSISRVPIELWCNLDDGTELYSTISPSNRIKLKINGKLYRS